MWYVLTLAYLDEEWVRAELPSPGLQRPGKGVYPSSILIGQELLIPPLIGHWGEPLASPSSLHPLMIGRLTHKSQDLGQVRGGSAARSLRVDDSPALRKSKTLNWLNTQESPPY